MARSLRIEYEGAIYHITSRGNERKKIFFTKRDYARFKEYLEIAQERFDCSVFAYVLMGNHYHLILQTQAANLSKVMHYLNSSYTTYINVKRKRSGHLLQGRFKAIVVDGDSYLLELSRYLHLNPVRAGMAQRPEDYPYSSYKAYTIPSEKDCVKTGIILEMTAKSSSVASRKYRDFVESGLGAELVSPLINVYGGLILGSEMFIRQTLDLLDRDLLDDEEIAQRKALQASVDQEIVLKVVARHFGAIEGDPVIESSMKARNFAIYLLKHQAGMTSQEVSHVLGKISSAAVAKVYQRLAKHLELNKKLREEMDGLKVELSIVQV